MTLKNIKYLFPFDTRVTIDEVIFVDDGEHFNRVKTNRIETRTFVSDLDEKILDREIGLIVPSSENNIFIEFWVEE